MSNEELIAEARRWDTPEIAQHVSGELLKVVRGLADALEAQSAPLVADSRESLFGLIAQSLATGGGQAFAPRGGNAWRSAEGIVTALFASGMVSLAADRDRERVAWERGRIFGEENWSEPYDPDDYNPYRKSEVAVEVGDRYSCADLGHEQSDDCKHPDHAESEGK